MAHRCLIVVLLVCAVGCDESRPTVHADAGSDIDAGSDVPLHPVCTFWPESCVEGKRYGCNPWTGEHDVELGACPSDYACTVVGCLPHCTNDGDFCSGDGHVAWHCSPWSEVPVGVTVCSGKTAMCLDGRCVPECHGASNGCADKFTRFTCAEGDTKPTLAPCPANTRLCLDGACTEMCSEDFASCTGKDAERCVTGKVYEWSSCGVDAICKDGVCIPLECSAGTSKCVDGMRVGCVNNKWTKPEPCQVCGRATVRPTPSNLCA